MESQRPFGTGGAAGWAFVSSCDGMSRNAAEASLKAWTQGFH